MSVQTSKNTALNNNDVRHKLIMVVGGNNWRIFQKKKPIQLQYKKNKIQAKK